ncbi:MAG: TRAP transporter small permease subunit [Synergistetes bacterium]|nr:MAG: Tripartite ATP-independent periplasmic transporter DctQ component [bacterium 42_11]MBC7330900.1 TRAP transporter small permease subunit [Synergistota bacterium]MDK2870859.1 TRAP-type transport system small permease protein [bacterium]
MTFLNKLDRFMGKFLRFMSLFSLVALFFLVLGNVVFRFIPIFSFGWFDEIVEMMFAYFVFYGSAALWREGEHFVVYLIPSKFKGNARRAFDITIGIINILFFLVFFLYSLELTIRATDWTPIFRLPKRILYSCMPVSGFIMLLYSIASFISCFRKECPPPERQISDF